MVDCGRSEEGVVRLEGPRHLRRIGVLVVALKVACQEQESQNETLRKMSVNGRSKIRNEAQQLGGERRTGEPVNSVNPKGAIQGRRVQGREV